VYLYLAMQSFSISTDVPLQGTEASGP